MTIREFAAKYGVSNKIAYQCTFGLKMKQDDGKMSYTEDDLYRNLKGIYKQRIAKKSADLQADERVMANIKFVHAKGGNG